MKSGVMKQEGGLVSDDVGVGMGLSDAVRLLAGRDMWHIGLDAAGVTEVLVADCGHGVTLCGERTSPSTCLPTGIGMASTWNGALMEEAGRLLGRECLALGVSILLGPKVNLHRIPLNGRSFETFSEDPLLAGRLAAALIRGVQSQGVGACVKAAACNNQQHEQHGTDVVVDERTLRELYLRVFEIAIAEGDPCALMTSYNPLHGVNAGENRWLLTGVVKGDWGFEGFVVSDWRALATEAVYASGMDLEMPGPGKLLDAASLESAMDRGLIDEDAVLDRAGRIARMLRKYGRPEEGREEFSGYLDCGAHRSLALRIAEESVVLLKNEDGVLPLDRGVCGSIAVIGPNASEARMGGGGSASVTPFYSVSPLEGIRECAGEGVEVIYEEGCSHTGTMEAVRGVWDSLVAEFFNGGEVGGKPDASWEVPHIDYSWGWAAPGAGVTRFEYAVRFCGRLTARHDGVHRFGVFAQEGGVRMSVDGRMVVDEWSPLHSEGDFEGAYATHYDTVECVLAAGESVEIELHYGKRAARAAVRLEWEEPGRESPMDRAVDLASRSGTVVLCVGLSNLFEGGAKDRECLGLPDSQVELIERVADVNPRTIVVLNNGGPVAMPWEPCVAALIEAWYPGQEGGRALARILFGEAEPGGRLPDTLPRALEDHASAANYPGKDGRVEYEEGVFIGYRHFDHAGIEPHYPFGYGLSYTTFAIGRPEFDPSGILDGGAGVLAVEVRNTGERAGSEVVQCYAGAVDPMVPRPEKELCGFEKVWLEPGASRTVAIKIRLRDLAYWDVRNRGWRVDAGEYRLYCGRHSRSLDSVVWRLDDGVFLGLHGGGSAS